MKMKKIDWNQEQILGSFEELSEECQYSVEGACGGSGDFLAGPTVRDLNNSRNPGGIW